LPHWGQECATFGEQAARRCIRKGVSPLPHWGQECATFGEQDIRYGAGWSIRVWRLRRRWVTLGVHAALGIISRAGLGGQ